jgi:organic radical activating enzyme
MVDVRQGRILTWSLEAHVADGCNLRCAHCCTLSPYLPGRFTSAADLGRDLALARQALAPNVFKVTGGEPLLHPDIVGVLEAARASGISERIQVTTNGFLARTAPDGFWGLIDRLTLSLYPSAPLPGDTIAYVRERCAERNVVLTEKRVSEFSVMDAHPPGNADERAREVYRECWLKNRCHMVHRGRFYVCTRPPHLEARLLQLGKRAPLSEKDGADLDGPDLARRILALLESPEPLASCTYCLGASGCTRAHEQLPRRTASRL